MKKMKLAAALLGSVLALGATAPSNAATFVGNLSIFDYPAVDDFGLFSFNVGTASTVLIRSWGYAGGVTGDGVIVERGGFDPIVSLYDSAGDLITFNDDGGLSVAPDAISGNRYDSYLTRVLSTGTYYVSVSAWPAFPAAGQHIDISSFDPFDSNSYDHTVLDTGSFTDATINPSDPNKGRRGTGWTVEVAQTAIVGSVPEPASWAMMITGFGLVGGAMRYRRATRVRAAIA